MAISVNHSTPSDASFSVEGAAAWDADHTLSGLGTMAEQNANNVAITGGSITGVSGIGTVTSVSGSAPIVSSGGNTPAISIPAATGSVNGYLTSTDWTTFSNKQPAGSYLTAIIADAPLSGSGTSASHLIISQASTSTNGYLSSTDWNTFNGKSNTNGTVTSISATPGTGISITGSPITTNGTLVIANTAPDQIVAFTNGTGISVTGTYPNFTIANTSPSSGGTVTSVSGTAPVVSSGGNTPAISMPVATSLVSGYLSNTDWATFNNKQATLVSATNIKTINGSTILGSGDLVVTGSFTGGTLTSQLKLATGTASAGTAPLEFVAGPVNTAAEAGAIEYDGNAFYSSVATSTRGVVPSEQIVVLTSNNTLTSQTAAQAIFDGGGGPAGGAVTLPVGTYLYETNICITGMSSTSGSFGFVLGGTATKTYSFSAQAAKAGTSLTTPMAMVSTCGTAAITTLVANSTGTVGQAVIRGAIRVTVAGTLIPQISLTSAAAAVIQANGYFKVTPIGNATVATIGNWA